MNLFKSHVRTHERRSASGAVSAVREHDRMTLRTTTHKDGYQKHRIMVDKKPVGHVSGYPHNLMTDTPEGGVKAGEKAFHISVTELSSAEHRGQGHWQEAVQRIAAQHPGGAFVHAFELSTMGTKAIKKIPGVKLVKYSRGGGDYWLVPGKMEKSESTVHQHLRHTKSGAVEVVHEHRRTVKAYKLFRTDKRYPGQLFPLYVHANEAVPVGEWVAAKMGTPDPKKKTHVKSKLGPLAFRPGWHSGDMPVATHIGGKKKSEDGKRPSKPNYRPDNHVWAEVEVADDGGRWQEEANRRASYTKKGKMIPKTAHITDQLPTGGHYRYKTNSNMTGNWIISGEMKVNRVLSDEEVKKINDAHGVADLPRLSKSQDGAVYFSDVNWIDNMGHDLLIKARRPKAKTAQEYLDLFKSYSPEQKNKIKRVMGEWKAGKLTTAHGTVVTDKHQAIAIAIAEAGASLKKSHVKEHVRRTKSGAATNVRAYDNKTEKGTGYRPTGHEIDHKEYPKRLKDKTDEQLHFIIKDASEAIKAKPDNPKCGYYADEVHYCNMELARRKGHKLNKSQRTLIY